MLIAYFEEKIHFIT